MELLEDKRHTLVSVTLLSSAFTSSGNGGTMGPVDKEYGVFGADPRGLIHSLLTGCMCLTLDSAPHGEALATTGAAPPLS